MQPKLVDACVVDKAGCTIVVPGAIAYTAVLRYSLETWRSCRGPCREYTSFLPSFLVTRLAEYCGFKFKGSGKTECCVH